jgi:endonuclease G
MKKILAIISIILFTSIASAQTCKEMVFGGIFPTTVEKTTIICHKRYVVGYSTARKAPLWVAEMITAAEVANANGVRKDAFRQDPAIPSNQQATLLDFAGTIYDRGHMVPFEDLADDLVAANEGFFLTNIVPQASTNNRGIWNALEGRVRKLAVAKGTIFVVTGPLFAATPTTLKSGAQVPAQLYKIVLSPSTTESYTFVLPNTNGLATSSLPLYFTTIANFKKTNMGINPVPAKGTFVDRKVFK